MRLLTYNIHRWIGGDGRTDLRRLATLLENSGADVVTLQEVIHPLPDGSVPLARLAERLGMEWVFGLANDQTWWQGYKVRLGNAILSRTPILSTTNKSLPGMPGLSGRAVLTARIQLTERSIGTIHTTHLDFMLEPLRWAQLTAVQQVLRRHDDEPHWLTGDFNAPSLSGTYSQLLAYPIIHRLRRSGYVDAFVVAGRGRAATFPAGNPFLRLDYLFVAGRWARGLRDCWTLSGALARHASDHRPVVAEWDARL